MDLRQLRNLRGLQRKFVTSKLQICGKHLNDIEAGRVNLTEKLAKKIADFYGIDIEVIEKMYKEGKLNNEQRRSRKSSEKIT